MRFKRQHRAGSAEFDGKLLRAADHCAMAKMRAVEIADRKDRALQPRRRTFRVDGHYE